MKPKIAFCVIATGDKDLENLKMLYESIYRYVHTVHITANGTETTKLEEWCSDHFIHYTHLPWNDDFSEQRNYNFTEIPEDTDFILWADSDDVIVGGEHIPHIAQIAKEREFDSVFFPYWYGCRFEGEPHPKNFKEVELTQMRERLIRVGATKWKGRIHETPIPVNGQNHTYSKIEYAKQIDTKKGKYPIAWLHLGADRNIPEEKQKARMDRNQRLLELQLADERKTGKADPRTLLYLMKIYVESKDEKLLKECISMGEEYLESSGWDAERALCTSLISKCMGLLGQEEQAVELLHKAVAEYPYDPLLYLYLARGYFNLKNYRAMKHWMEIALSLDLDNSHTNFNNILELKILSTELFLKYYLNADKNAQKAWEAAERLYKLNPTKSNRENEEYLYDMKELDIASRHADLYIKYLEDIDDQEGIVKTIESMPGEMRKLPFANNLYNKYKSPKVWGEREICYFANFGQAHFEHWSPKSLEKGIGGSETAVIKLSEEWVKLGYKVTVYGDPGREEGEYNGVTYLPWYKFNKKDKFNIFIQWRSSSMAGKISTKKFYVDLHDVTYSYDHIKRLDSIDKLLVKSQYHSDLIKEVPEQKKLIISNGI